MTTEEIQISGINNLKSLRKSLIDVRKNIEKWRSFRERQISFKQETDEQIKRLQEEEKYYENELLTLIEKL